MRPLYLFALALLVASTPATQAQRAAPISVSAGMLDAESRRAVDPTALRRFNPDSAQSVIGVQDGSDGTPGGYVFGTNRYIDLAKAVWLELPEGTTATTLSAVNVYMGRAEGALIPDYDIKVYAAVADGSGGYSPGDELYSQTYPTADLPLIPTGEDETLPMMAHAFDAPVAIDETNAPDGVFFVGVDVADDLYELATEDIAIASSGGLADVSPYEWELWSDATWHNVADAWGSNGWNMWIEAIADLAVANEGTAASVETGIVSLYPNPARETVQLSLRSADAASARAVVYDLLGRSVLTAFDGVLGASERTVSFSTASLAAGSYIVRFESGRTAQTERLVVVK